MTKGVVERDFAVAAVTPRGAIDWNYIGGRGQTPFSGLGQDTARASAVQFDGRMVVAGESGGCLALTRFNLDGSLDRTFGIDGRVVEVCGPNPVRVTDVASGPGGRLVVLLEVNGRYLVYRYLISGQINSTFGVNGRIVTGISVATSGAGSVLIQDLGRVLCAFSTNGWRDAHQIPDQRQTQPGLGDQGRHHDQGHQFWRYDRAGG